MSRIAYSAEPDLIPLGDGEWLVARPFTVWWGRHIVRVQPGFETDLFSIPAWLRWLVRPPTAASPAAVVHDWLYDYDGGLTRAEADALFYDALRLYGVSIATAWLMWAACRAFGERLWGPEDGDPPLAA